MTLAEKIRNLRKQNNITQEALAEEMNVSRQTISKWENGTTIPDVNNICELARFFQVTTDFLLNYNDYQTEKKIKKYFLLDLLVLIFGICGSIIMSILLFTHQLDATSSTIIINSYGISLIIFFVLFIFSAIRLIKRRNEKE